MKSKPNVVLVVMDTARAADIGTTKSGEDITPTINALANEGTQFERAFASSPWTLPSHASMFSGTYPSRHGANSEHKYLENHLTTLSEAFRDSGYETVAVSNNTWISEEFGFSRGFERFHRTWQYVQSKTDLGQIARTYEGKEKYVEVIKELLTGNPVINFTNAVYGQFFRKQEDDGAQRTNKWIRKWLSKKNTDQPFFLFANYLEPHLEYRPPEGFANQFLQSGVSEEEAMEVSQDAWAYIAGQTEHSEKDWEILQALYQAEIAYLDKRIRELKDMLEEQGEWQNTVVIITSDHGENIGDHGLMDHQYCLYDTLLHVPLIVHGGAFTGGQTNGDIVQLTDLAPTLLDSAGIEAPDFRKQIQGRSFHPDANAGTRKFAFAEYMAPQPSMEALEKRVGDLPAEVYKYDRSLRAIRSTDWKLIRGSDGSQELYDVSNDPGETDDIADTHETIVAELSGELESWLDSFESANLKGDVSMDEDTKARLEDLGYLQ